MLIVTKWLPATDTKGKCVKATIPYFKLSATLAWDSQLTSLDNERDAVLAVCRKFNESEPVKLFGELTMIRLTGPLTGDAWEDRMAWCAETMSGRPAWDVPSA